MNKFYFGDNLRTVRKYIGIVRIASVSILAVNLFWGCNVKKSDQVKERDSQVSTAKRSAAKHSGDALADTSGLEIPGPPEIPGPKVGDTVSMLSGHFESMERIDTISVIKVKDGTDADNPDVYQIKFSSGEKPLKRAPYGGWLIDEGDLNGDSLHEFSVFADPLHGCTYDFITFTHKRGKWRRLFDEFLIPTGCDPISDSELQSRVFCKDGIVYYREEDFADTNWRLVTKRAKLFDQDAK